MICLRVRPVTVGGYMPRYCVALLVTLVCLPVLAAETDPGQVDLDAATLAKLTAKQLNDLEQVIDLCESALEKGLNEQNSEYAEDLMASTLYEHASRLSRLIFERQQVDPRWPQIRKICVEKARQSLQLRPELGATHLLLAKLLALPQGDRDAALEAANRAVELLTEDPDQLSDAYRIRGGLQSDREKALADLNQSVELNPRSKDAWRARGLFFLMGREDEKAMADFEQLLERDPDDVVAHQALAQNLSEQKRFDEAIEHLDRILEKNPRSVTAHTLKARIQESRGNFDEAVASLNSALDANPRDVGALLYRARLRTHQQQFELARSDIDSVLRLQPKLPQAILLRSIVSAAQNRMSEAIGDLQSLIKRSPENSDLKMQLAAYFEADRRPRRAIETYDQILEAYPENAQVLRRRADALLSVGRQTDALKDYQMALQKMPNDPSTLNNLAWLLSTSPIEELRNGEQALVHAQKACEVTDYQKPHILSTLAACYAEMGNFDEAISWSQKAVDLDQNQEPQLAKELESYHAKKPWRERQLVEENNSELITDTDGEEEDLPIFEEDSTTESSDNTDLDNNDLE